MAIGSVLNPTTAVQQLHKKANYLLKCHFVNSSNWKRDDFCNNAFQQCVAAAQTHWTFDV